MSRPRSNSMTEAFRRRADYAPLIPHSQAIATLAQSNRNRVDEFISALPNLTEQDLTTFGLEDSSCPICITPFNAIFAEAEMAIAMESPAHPIDEQGIVKLHQTCGHVFCRKDIKNWLRSGRNSCPTCRRPITDFELDISHSSMPPLQDWELINRITMGVRRVLAMNPQEEGLVDASAQHQGQQDPPDRDDRDEFSGMYS